MDETRPSLARRLGRVALVVLGSIAALVALALIAVYAASGRAMARRFDVKGEPLALPAPSPQTLADGKRLATTRGCLECHGQGGEGRVFIEAMPVMKLAGTNISPGGKTRDYSPQDWTRAVRHGVRPDGSAIVFMPCEDYRFMDDEDLGLIVAYLKTLPPSGNTPPASTIGPVGRALYLAGKLPLVAAERLDHAAPVPAKPPVAPTAEYGAYLTRACAGCHGERFSGGPIPGVPPEWPPAGNLTPDRQSGLGRRTQEQFAATLRTGKLPEGRSIDPTHMPWPQLGQLTDTEIGAMWAFFASLPPRPAGGR